ncbi:MAG: glycosyltransferase [Candidatus Zambryskibacteria bacterium]|nr:glycosyltransferase [Candidatus Zambryskibacteria bacterium]
MKILVITQTVDIHSTTLGFFTRWIEEFSKRFETVEVVCLLEGKCVLPTNVRVHSLGKEELEGIGHLPAQAGMSEVRKKIQYIIKFYSYIWKYRNEYDAVFVHMNQEYIVLGGFLWKLLSKKIFFWRNHPYGNTWTRIAVWFSDMVFCTADKSFTASYKKTKLMPAGVDTGIFTIDPNVTREKNSLLCFGRIAPVKRIERAIDLTATLLAKGISVTLSVVGDALPRDAVYVEELKKRVMEAKIEPAVHFVRGVDFIRAPEAYQSHEVLLNFTDSGSFDKTVIEALACGAKVLVSNTSMKDILPQGSFTPGDIEDVQEKIKNLLSLNGVESAQYENMAKELVEKQSLKVLMDRLASYISNSKISL